VSKASEAPRTDREAIAELLSKVKMMGETGLFLILTLDPQTKGYFAVGEPVDGPTAAIMAGERRAALDSSQLEDVEVLIAPWVPWDE
jgi:hypothetical protein